VSNRVSRRQANRWQDQADAQAYQEQQYAPPPPQQQQQYAPPPPPQGDDMDDKIASLTKLGQLRDQGILTDAEFEVQKAKVLAG
jgi:putative oligomerization/nucleic acid binding protein